MKKWKSFSLIIPFLFLTCSCQAPKKSFEAFFGYIRHSGKINYEDIGFNINYTYDGDSFIDNNQDMYYCYLPYLSKYQRYRLDSNEVSIDTYLFDNYVDYLMNIYESGKYIQKDNETLIVDGEYLNSCKLPYFTENIDSLKIVYEGDYVCFYYEFVNNTGTIIYLSRSDKDINNYFYKDADAKDYLTKIGIDENELLHLIDNKSSFLLVITSPTCSSCINSEKYYYEASLEYSNLRFASIETKDLSKLFYIELLKEIQNVYNNQPDKEKLDGYDTYDNYLTPSNLFFKDGELISVSLGLEYYDFVFSNMISNI